MSKQNIIIVGVVVVIVAVAVAFGVNEFLKQQGGEQPPAGEGPAGTAGEPTGEPGQVPPVGEPVSGEEFPPAGEIAGEPVSEVPEWQNPDEPKQSSAMGESEVPKGAVELDITAAGFSPASFEVKKGAEVLLAVTSKDQWMHGFAFKDESLKDVRITVSSGETRATTFYAPSKAGEYEFYCGIPGHEGRGEKGKMIVK